MQFNHTFERWWIKCIHFPLVQTWHSGVCCSSWSPGTWSRWTSFMMIPFQWRSDSIWASGSRAMTGKASGLARRGSFVGQASRIFSGVIRSSYNHMCTRLSHWFGNTGFVRNGAQSSRVEDGCVIHGVVGFPYFILSIFPPPPGNWSGYFCSESEEGRCQ